MVSHEFESRVGWSNRFFATVARRQSPAERRRQIEVLWWHQQASTHEGETKIRKRFFQMSKDTVRWGTQSGGWLLNWFCAQDQHAPKRRAASTQLRMQGRTMPNHMLRNRFSPKSASNVIKHKFENTGWHLSFEPLGHPSKTRNVRLFGRSFVDRNGPFGRFGSAISKRGVLEMSPFSWFGPPSWGQKK